MSRRFNPAPADQTAAALHHLEVTIMSALSDLQAQVAQNTSVEQSAVSLIQGLAKQIATAVASDDSDALKNLSANLSASVAPLAAAVAANTVADPDAAVAAAAPIPPPAA